MHTICQIDIRENRRYSQVCIDNPDTLTQDENKLNKTPYKSWIFILPA